MDRSRNSQQQHGVFATGTGSGADNRVHSVFFAKSNWGDYFVLFGGWAAGEWQSLVHMCTCMQYYRAKALTWVRCDPAGCAFFVVRRAGTKAILQRLDDKQQNRTGLNVIQSNRFMLRRAVNTDQVNYSQRSQVPYMAWCKFNSTESLSIFR